LREDHLFHQIRPWKGHIDTEVAHDESQAVSDLYLGCGTILPTPGCWIWVMLLCFFLGASYHTSEKAVSIAPENLSDSSIFKCLQNQCNLNQALAAPENCTLRPSADVLKHEPET